MQRTTYRQLWDHAVPLSDAWLELASNESRDQYVRALGPGTTLFAMGLGAIFRREDYPQFQAELSEYPKKDSIEIELKAAVVSALAERSLFAVGYFGGQKPLLKPVKPNIFVDGDIEWNSSSIRWRTISFQKIRVARRIELSAELLRTIDQEWAPKKMGRPTHRARVSEALNIIFANSANLKHPNKAIAQMVRNQLQEKHGINADIEKGISDKTLEKMIAQYRKQFTFTAQ